MFLTGIHTGKWLRYQSIDGPHSAIQNLARCRSNHHFRPLGYRIRVGSLPFQKGLPSDQYFARLQEVFVLPATTLDRCLETPGLGRVPAVSDRTDLNLLKKWGSVTTRVKREHRVCIYWSNATTSQGFRSLARSVPETSRRWDSRVYRLLEHRSYLDQALSP